MQIKNAVIRQAENIRLGKITFEDRGLGEIDEPDTFRHVSYEYRALVDYIQTEGKELDDRLEAVEDLKRIADHGDCYAQYYIGKLYRDGGLLIPNAELAEVYLKKAAEDNHLAAQYALGKLYLSKDIEVHHSELGMQWLEIAANNGNDFAAYRLGKEYIRGRNTDKDIGKAVKWFKQSAENGNPYAQYMLGKLYLMGQELPQDRKLGTYWLTQSAQQGNQYAGFVLQHADRNHTLHLFWSVTQILYHMSQIFRSNSVPQSHPRGVHIDKKRLRELIEKRQAMGCKDMRFDSLTM